MFVLYVVTNSESILSIYQNSYQVGHVHTEKFWEWISHIQIIFIFWSLIP